MRFFLLDGGAIAVLLLLIVLLPLGAGGAASGVIVGWMTGHICTVGAVYSGLAFLMGLGCYWKRRLGERLLGAAANTLIFLPLAAVEVLQVFPQMQMKGICSADEMTQWLIASLLLFLVTCFIQMLGLSFASCFWHLAIAVIFCTVAGVLLRCFVSPADVTVLCGIYGFA